MNPLLLALTGALAGLHAATWGGFKDSPFEGFKTTSFVRSLALGVAWGGAVASSGLVGSSTGILVPLGVCYAGERLATEWWKAIVREDAQSAYSIPMRLAVRGRPVDARLPRYAVGAAVALGLATACVLAWALDEGPGELPSWATVLVIGAGGWLTALGGAWKDAPVEGFELRKFFRSPGVATAWGCLLLPFSESVLLVAVAAAGLSVATIETYKTFLAGGAPGKFAGKPESFEAGKARERCRWAHGGLYGVLVAAVAVDLLQAPDAGTLGGLARDAGLLVAVVWASCWGALVLAPPNSATVEVSSGPGPVPGRPERLSDADIRGAGR